MKKQKLYLISGLGADERAFKFLNLPGVDFSFIKWVQPSAKEEIISYSKRLISQIDTNYEVILVGLSFGGIIAQEIAKLICCRAVIIISSVKSPEEFPWYYKGVKASRVYKLMPPSLLKRLNLLTASYYFGIDSGEELNLLKLIIKDTDELFLKWAIHETLNWQPFLPKQTVVHIHGSRDRIFPARNIRGAINIKGGGHFMIVNKASEISQLILRVFNSTH